MGQQPQGAKQCCRTVGNIRDGDCVFCGRRALLGGLKGRRRCRSRAAWEKSDASAVARRELSTTVGAGTATCSTRWVQSRRIALAINKFFRRLLKGLG